MTELAGIIVLLAVLGYCAVSERARRSVFTPPIAFAALGLVLGPAALGWLDADVDDAVVHVLAEATLVVILFADASRIDLHTLRLELGLPVRLLLVGMPLTILLGFVAGLWLLPELGLWEVAVLAALLAPTDAALGSAVVEQEVVPLRVRQALNVESGLNDGMALPFVAIFAGLAAAAANVGGSEPPDGGWIVHAVAQVTLGPLAGVVCALGGARLASRAARSAWSAPGHEQLMGITIALLSFAAAELIGGNGFIAAFAAGMTARHVAPAFCERTHELVEAEGHVLMLLVFFALGAVLAWPAIRATGGAALLYAALSLTVVRMIPVALAMIGTGVRPATTLFLGWFGPRGLASVVVGLLILGETELPHRLLIWETCMLTVLMSMLLHGLTAVPGARWYGALVGRSLAPTAPEHHEVTAHRLRIQRPTRVIRKGGGDDERRPR